MASSSDVDEGLLPFQKRRHYTVDKSKNIISVGLDQNENDMSLENSQLNNRKQIVVLRLK